ncbi:TIGR03087 family PEP-CTERM/XrtA system glycosyltransferase [Novosphingobium sp.]|uniref:TIGR03087 family PEP-CTERM/XrtA system glycosyltransferase n=1 Tax=Novosphingobium sp. TaxID=1874826 RepID=UPI00286A6080|nr:TIGR03087 family PEP-CTERM/XrtA system glycosyltransferase [Novosphingobium sp.]
MSGEILFLSHRIPFPPNRGDKIRSHHILRHLAALAPVHVATFADDLADMAAESELAALCASHCLVQRTKPLWRAGIKAVASGKPVSLTAFQSPQLSAYVRAVLASGRVDTIYAFSGQMGQYIPGTFAGRVLFDFVDVDSAKFEAYAETGKGPRRWIDAREGWLLAAEEARLAARSQVSLLVSNEEAALFRARLDPALQATCDVRALRNGIDSALFDPAACTPAPAMLQCPGPRLIFAGQMDYPPNVAAALRAAQQILPAIRAQLPQATLHIAGRNPPADLRALHGKNGVNVWGAVADIREWLVAADLALVPLTIARGVQNKVLEAMSMALPVVLTPAAATGIGGSDGATYAVGESDAALADRTIDLLSDPGFAAQLGQNARRFVVEGLSWDATLAPLAAMLGLGAAAARHAA